MQDEKRNDKTSFRLSDLLLIIVRFLQIEQFPERRGRFDSVRTRKDAYAFGKNVHDLFGIGNARRRRDEELPVGAFDEVFERNASLIEIGHHRPDALYLRGVKYFYDRKLKDISDEFNISQSRISRIIQNGLDKIKKELLKQEELDEDNI